MKAEILFLSITILSLLLASGNGASIKPVLIHVSTGECKGTGKHWRSSQKEVSSSLFQSRIGVNYGRIADNLMPPSQVVQLLKSSTAIRKVKLFDTEPSVLSAFANTDFSLVVAAPNYLLSDLASDPLKAAQWLNTSVAAFYPATNITHIAIGNEVAAQSDDSLKRNVLPAMNNVYAALQKLKLHKRIKVSTPHALSILASSYPPSNSSFQEGLRESFILPVLRFLNSTSNPFMINIYPYFAYSGAPSSIPLEFVLFGSHSKVEVDPMSGLSYTNMFDAQLDALSFAMQSLGFSSIPLLVSESGWPSSGEDSEAGASLENARQYLENLVKHLASEPSFGTPARPNSPAEVYIFALFNEDQKPGKKSERNFGLFQPNGTPVYSSEVLMKPNSRTRFRRKRRGVSPHHQEFRSSQSSFSEWCVAKPGAESDALQKGITYACQESGIDCSPIQINGTCFTPQNLFAHASFVYNSYFQKMGRNTWNCYFQDTAMITVSDPSYKSCRYASPSSS